MSSTRRLFSFMSTMMLFPIFQYSSIAQPKGGNSLPEDKIRIAKRMDSIFKDTEFHLKVTSVCYTYPRSITDDNSYFAHEYKSDQKEICFTLFFVESYDSVYYHRVKDFKWTFEGVPEQMKFDKSQKKMTWEAPYIKSGDYTIKAKVTNGIFTDSIKILFRVNEEWKTTLLPGINGVYYAPADKSLGYFTGVGVEYLFYGGIHKNNNTGPSHSKFYLRLDMMNSSIDTVGLAFLFNVGVHLSVERNPVRKFFVPYFGLECGSIYQRLSGTTFQVTPLIGVWLFSEQNTFISAQFGYLYAAGALETMRGYRAGIGINFSLW